MNIENPLNKLNENRLAILHQIDVIQAHLKENPKDYTVMFALAIRHYALDEYRKCALICHKLINLRAEQVEIYDLAGRADIKAGYYEDAMAALNQGVKLFPDNYGLHLQLATALNALGQYEKAEAIFKQAKELGNDHPAKYIGLSNYYAGLGRIDEAMKELKSGADAFPDSALILSNMGTLYTRLDEDLLASECYLKALRIDPENTNYLVNIGGSFASMKKSDIAVKFYDEALKIDPKFCSAMCAKGGLLANHGQAQEYLSLMAEGLELYRKMPEVSNTNYLTYYSNYIFFLHYAPNIERKKFFDEIIQWQKELCSDIEEKASITFNNKCNKDKKLKIGLLSKGFNVHPVGQMIFPALENINKDAFEIHCYTELPADKRDYLTDKIYAVSDRVININNEVNHVLVEKIRNDEIDILIEMTGHSEGGRRLQMIAERAAPVQVKWVGGLFNTSGVPQMDWLITDNVETPEGEDKWYTEKLYRMPDDYIVYYPPYYAPKVSESPAQKNGFVTFGNLNNLAKTNSYSIELWSKILHAVPNSKLLLKGNKMDTPFVVEHLQKSFETHGIGIDRLLIEGGESHQKFLNVYNRFDIALDPHPYTGGLTTCEALWMGVPVVTLPGETFAGRHAATHLTNAGMPEWIAKDEQDYIDIAVKWASDLDALAKLRSGLREHVSKTPLVDGPRFAKNFEIALRHMWGEWCDQKIATQNSKTQSKSKKGK